MGDGPVSRYFGRAKLESFFAVLDSILELAQNVGPLRLLGLYTFLFANQF